MVGNGGNKARLALLNLSSCTALSAKWALLRVVRMYLFIN